MGKTFGFEIHRTSTAPAATLFRLETDGGRWSDWAKPAIVQSSWEREASPVGGVGAIRKVGLWPLLMREETIEFEQDRRHVYAFAGPPAPVKDYRAEVVFTPKPDGGTDIRWTGSFTESLPGTGGIQLAVLKTAIRVLSARLVAAAERNS
ncbi:Polyketide cyclase / dehydrase and lipid transport [Amycolatopsis xylanica]|uniref:Polyketide cyclase / dehydrase and lipid transport n=1 Tax=Amycolatopsis xylanica TaxID=589385 RepID=A0A1H2ZHY7_9PSEU|nr:SRPBCC family protein [Amycolatopsis xylanica]SDX17083.1 Polyketide cyclase / dehydrase and lipid transport [Amycolatopsis xylanica]